jgi:hypothetical protein
MSKQTEQQTYITKYETGRSRDIHHHLLAAMGSLLSLPTVICVYVSVVGAITLQIYWKRRSVSELKGPETSSWLVGEFVSRFLQNASNSCNLGHTRDLRDEESTGDLQFAWFREHGNVHRLKGLFGVGLISAVS